MPRSVLIVEDEAIIRASLREFLSAEGYQVAEAGTLAAAIVHARQRDFHVVICDVQLPDGDGIALLRRLRQLNPNVSGLIITAYATVENAVEAFKSGAFDYLVKPVIFDDLANKLTRLFQYSELALENQALRRELTRHVGGEEIVGSSKAISNVQEALRRAAITNSNVLLAGESGTGKELFARTLHKWGQKHHEQFVAINCATRPAELLEGQLFGAKSGTVPGVTGDLPGCLRQSTTGTVFFDEISLLPLSTQAKLLRAIEYQEVTPLGTYEPYRTQARIVAATTRDLIQEVAANRCQEELFYRLDGIKIQVPALRERLDDVPELVEFFVSKHGRAMGQKATGATSETIRLLMSNPWKGNVRQLDNAIERAVMMCDGMQIRPNDLPPDIRGDEQPLPDTDDLRSAIRHYERFHISRVLRQWPEKREAAKRLKLGLSSLYRKIEELGIDL